MTLPELAGCGRSARRSWGRRVRRGAVRLGKALERSGSHQGRLGRPSRLSIALWKRRRRKGKLVNCEQYLGFGGKMGVLFVGFHCARGWNELTREVVVAVRACEKVWRPRK